MKPEGAVTLLIPQSHVAYACERNLVCCQAPTRAPCEEPDLASMRLALERTDAGRALFQIVVNRRETVPRPDGDTIVFAQEAGRCVHLDHETPSCHVHATGGLDALSLACRNFPRLVTQFGDTIEVAFNLTCPTAARLLVENPAPIAFCEVHTSDFPYPVSRVAPATFTVVPGEADAVVDMPRLNALRRAWWKVFATDRADPARLISRVSWLLFAPDDPPEDADTIDPRIVHEDFFAGVSALQSHLFALGLERIPERGATYLAHRPVVAPEVMSPITSKALKAAAAGMAEVLHAYLDHQVLLAGVHDGRPVGPWLETVARRVIGIIRHVHALGHRVPFAPDRLLADVISASMLVEPLAPRPHPEDVGLDEAPVGRGHRR